jgi:hypothetical protein
MDRVHELERRLNIRNPWVPNSDEWEAARKKVMERDYRKAVDRLESLIVSRIFELSKMNMSETGIYSCNYTWFSSPNAYLGYKLRTHIARALQSRSHAIKKALETYNCAASTLQSSAPQLSWEQIVDYAFLSEFDLLRDVRQDVREKPWASPGNRILRDNYFKIERAREEIERLNIEICRVITYMADETDFLNAMEAELAQENPELAYQVSRYHMERGRALSTHQARFKKLFKDPRFTGTSIPGRSVHLPPSPDRPTPAAVPSSSDNLDGNADEDEDISEDEDDDLDDITYMVLSLAMNDDGRDLESIEP